MRTANRPFKLTISYCELCRERNPRAPAMPSADLPHSIPLAPRRLSKCLKTLKTARASYWLKLAWIWDRRHVHSGLWAMLPQFENLMISIFENIKVCHDYFSSSRRIAHVDERR